MFVLGGWGVEGIKVVDHRHLPSFVHQRVHEVAPDEPGTSGHQRRTRDVMVECVHGKTYGVSSY
jgi:hypothetical protein